MHACRLVGSIAAVAAALAFRPAAAQVLPDSFGDGVAGPYWTVRTPSPAGGAAVVERNGRLEFTASIFPQYPSFRFAGYLGRDWVIPFTGEIRAKAAFNAQPTGVTGTASSESGICMAVCDASSGLTALGLPNGWMIGLGTYRSSSGQLLRVFSVNLIQPGGGLSEVELAFASMEEPTLFRRSGESTVRYTIPISGTMFVRCVASSRAIAVSFSGYGSADEFVYQPAFPPEMGAAVLAVGGYAQLQASLSGSATWIDDVSLDLGSLQAAPTNFAATDSTLLDRVRLTWNAGVGSGRTGYRVMRRQPGGSFATLSGGLLAAGATSFDDLTALPGVLYEYKLMTRFATGEWLEVADTGARLGDGQCASAANVHAFVHGGVRYEVVRELKTWASAAACAVDRGGYLAQIDSAAEQAAIYAGIQAAGVSPTYNPIDMGGGASYVWIGGTDRALEGQWLWNGDNAGGGTQFWQGNFGGSAVGGRYSNWGTNAQGVRQEPDDFEGQDAAAIGLSKWPVGFPEQYGAAGQWNDIAESSLCYYVIEAALPAPLNVAATDGTSASGVTVSWSAVTGASGYRVYRALGTATPVQVGGNLAAGATSFVDGSAVAGTVYTYFVRALAGTREGGATVGDAGWRNLPAPSGVNATDGTSAANVTVTWSAVTGATGYKVLRATGTAVPTAQVGGNVAAGTTTFADTTAVAGTVYSYAVKAICAAGTSASSASNTGWRSIAAPTGVNATDGTSTANVTVTWTGVAGATGYKVFRAVGSAAGVQVGGVLPAAAASFVDSTAAAGTLYSYSVRATAAAGDGAASAANTGWRNVLPPAGVSATDGTSMANVTVTWSPVTGATGYRVFRAVGAGAASEIGAPVAASFADATAVAGTLYSYTVRARTAPGDSAASAADSGWKSLPPPSGVNATDGTSTANVTVTWSAVTGATGYKVLRAVGSAAPSVQVGGIVAAGTTSFADTTAVAGTAYNYAVKAVAVAGDSGPSAPNAGWRNVPAPSGVSASDGSSTASVAVAWSAVPGATGYKVFRALGSATPTVQVGGNVAAGTTSFADTTAASGTVYNYAVRAVTAPGDSAASAANTGWRNVAPPAGITASDGTFSDRVGVQWTASPEASVTGYSILRQLPADPSPVEVGSVSPRTTVTFNDTGIPVGVVGTYYVVARTAAGDSQAGPPDTGFRAGSGAVLSGPPPAGDGRTGVPGAPAAADPAGSAAAGSSAPEGAADSERGGHAPVGDGGAADGAAVEPGAADTPGQEGAAPDLPMPDEQELIARVLDAARDAERDGTEAGRKMADRLRQMVPPGGKPVAGTECDAMRMLRGDVNLDGAVDAADLDAYLLAVKAGDPVGADLDRDGTVGHLDLEALVRAIGRAGR